jgi:hypothetical protein
MFEQDTDTKDRLFIAALIVAVFATLLGIHFYANHLQANERATPQEPRRVLHLEALTHVYECERDGQRVLTDRPCGTGVEIRVITKATPIQPRDTTAPGAGK